MTHYLITVSYDVGRGWPLPAPLGFLFRRTIRFYVQADHQPTFQEIKAAAINKGAKGEGFGVDAITALEPGFLNFDEPTPGGEAETI